MFVIASLWSTQEYRPEVVSDLIGVIFSELTRGEWRVSSFVDDHLWAGGPALWNEFGCTLKAALHWFRSAHHLVI